MPEARESQGGLGGFIRRSGYLRKWLILGIAIGIIAGLGAVVFYLMLDYAGRFLLGFLGGYDVPTAYGDGGDKGRRASTTMGHPLITLGGALVSAFIVASSPRRPRPRHRQRGEPCTPTAGDPGARSTGQDGDERADDQVRRFGWPRG
jgi:hypothetical protein